MWIFVRCITILRYSNRLKSLCHCYHNTSIYYDEWFSHWITFTYILCILVEFMNVFSFFVSFRLPFFFFFFSSLLLFFCFLFRLQFIFISNILKQLLRQFFYHIRYKIHHQCKYHKAIHTRFNYVTAIL